MPPQDTRPRYVNPPPSLFDLINQGVAPTLPITPPTFPQQSNPYDALTQILASIQSQPLSQASQQSGLARVLEAIATGVGIGTSPNPGQALLGSLQNQQQQRNLREQQLQQRQNALNQIRLQIGMQQAQDLSREQQEIAREKRANLIEREREDRANTRQIESEKRQFQRALDLKEADIKYAIREKEALMDFRVKNEAILNKLTQNEILLQTLPERRKEAVELTTEYQMLAPEIDPEVLREIAYKVSGFDLEELSTGQKAILNKVSKKRSTMKMRRYEAETGKIEAERDATRSGLRYMGRGGAANDPFEQTLMRNLAKDYADNEQSMQYYKDKAGNILTQESYAKMSQLDRLRNEVKIVPPEENLQLRLAAQEKVLAAKDKAKQRTSLSATSSASMGDVPVIDATTGKDDVQIFIDDAKAKGATNIQIMSELKNRGASAEELQRAQQMLGTGKPTQTAGNKNTQFLEKNLGIGIAAPKVNTPLTNTTAASRIYGNTSAENRTNTARLLETYKKQTRKKNATYDDLLREWFPGK